MEIVFSFALLKVLNLLKYKLLRQSFKSKVKMEVGKDSEKAIQNDQDKSFLERTKCLFNNTGYYVCLDQKCHKSNPFICKSEACQCQTNHEDCIKKSLSTYRKNEKVITQPQNELQRQIDKVFDSRLIRQLEEAKARLKQEIRQGTTINHHFQLQSHNGSRTPSFLQSENLTGSILSQHLKKVQQSGIVKKLNGLKDLISKEADRFKRQQLYPMIRHIEDIVISQRPQIGWSPQLKAALIQIQGFKLKAKKNSRFYVALLSPSLLKLKGQIIKWKVKILSQNKSIGLGVCLREHLKKRDFEIKKDSTENGCYLNFNDGKLQAFRNEEMKENKLDGINFNDVGDIVSIEVDTIQWKMKFTKETKLGVVATSELKINFVPQLQTDDYHICVAFGQINAQVELLSPIQTSLGNIDF